MFLANPGLTWCKHSSAQRPPLSPSSLCSGSLAFLYSGGTQIIPSPGVLSGGGGLRLQWKGRGLSFGRTAGEKLPLE